MTKRPDRLNQIGFRTCEHPYCECSAYPGSFVTTRYCLTCGASLTRGEWRGGFGTGHFINYDLLERYGLMSGFEFFLRQRPESRAFGDI